VTRKFPFDFDTFNIDASIAKIDAGSYFNVESSEVTVNTGVSTDFTLTSSEGVEVPSFSINQVVIESYPEGGALGSGEGALKVDLELFEKSGRDSFDLIVKLSGVNLESGREIFNIDNTFLNLETPAKKEVYVSLANKDAANKAFKVYLRCNK